MNKVLVGQSRNLAAQLNHQMDFQHLPLPIGLFCNPLPISHFCEFERLEAMANDALRLFLHARYVNNECPYTDIQLG